MTYQPSGGIRINNGFKANSPNDSTWIIINNEAFDGLKCVQTKADMFNIPIQRLRAGTSLCYVGEEDSFYKLISIPTSGNTTDTNWRRLDLGGSGSALRPLGSITPVLVEGLEVDSGSSGDFYIVEGADPDGTEIDNEEAFGEIISVKDGDWIMKSQDGWKKLSMSLSVPNHGHDVKDINVTVGEETKPLMDFLSELYLSDENLADPNKPLREVQDTKIPSTKQVKDYVREAVPSMAGNRTYKVYDEEDITTVEEDLEVTLFVGDTVILDKDGEKPKFYRFIGGEPFDIQNFEIIGEGLAPEQILKIGNLPDDTLQELSDLVTSIVELKDGVAPEGDTLKKLYTKILNHADLINDIYLILQSDEETLDTFQEIVDFIESNREDLDNYVLELQNKVNKVEGKDLVETSKIAQLDALINAHKLTDSVDDTTAKLVTGNWNNYRDTGFYRGQNMDNASPGTHQWRYVTVIKHNESYCIQISYEFNLQNGSQYVRVYNGGVWEPWQKMNLFQYYGSISDADTALYDGYYNGRPFDNNHPDGGSHGTLISFGEHATGRRHIFIDDLGDMYVRARNYLGTWVDWKNVVTGSAKGRATLSKIDGTSPLEVINGSNARSLKVGGLVVSSDYSESPPTNGIRSKGNIVTDGNITAGGHSNTFGNWKFAVNDLVNNNKRALVSANSATRLDLNYAKDFTSGTYVHGGLTATENITAYSDRRLKKDIEPITNALGTIKKISGVKYRRKDIKEPKQEIGFIAQDLMEHVPEVVKKPDTDKDMYSVDYSKITALLVEGIKEQQKEIEVLKEELFKLKGVK